ncbi:MAG: hypothetical protein CMK59_09200 [Proteobacteria bacterium]|nr:hypothetical protein [Pseudomonadota bacterium]
MKTSTWNWQIGHKLSTPELYYILQLRMDVFVVEQECAYQDVDGCDLNCWHLTLSSSNTPHKIMAYLRVFPPKEKTVIIGRVIVASDFRKQGLGRTLMQEAHLRCHSFDFKTFQLSAQHHLQSFYEHLGYQAVGTPYDEDGIPHIKMVASKESASYPSN